MITTKTLLSGPTNCIRLENVDIGKILYVFIDAYYGTQMECDDPHSKYIDQYLLKKINRSDKVLDFFLQINFVQQLVDPDNSMTKKWKINHYEKIIDFFMKIYKNTDKVRAHYYDISYGIRYIIDDLIYINRTINKFKTDDPTLSEYNVIIDKLHVLYNDIGFINMLIFGTEKEISKNELPENLFKIIKYFTKVQTFTKKKENIKLFEDVYTYIKKLLDILFQNFDKLETMIIDMSKIYNENTPLTLIPNSYLYSIITPEVEDKLNKCSKLSDECLQNCIYIINEISNLYFIRRFIEKEYVTNAILYAHHNSAIQIIYLLVNKLNFKITNMSFNNIPIKDIETKLKNIEYDDYNYKLIASDILPKEFSQCINLEGFPTSFK